jgi:hypothetical protein
LENEGVGRFPLSELWAKVEGSFIDINEDISLLVLDFGLLGLWRGSLRWWGVDVEVALGLVEVILGTALVFCNLSEFV